MTEKQIETMNFLFDIEPSERTKEQIKQLNQNSRAAELLLIFYINTKSKFYNLNY